MPNRGGLSTSRAFRSKSISLNFSPRCALSCRPLYSYQRYHSPKNDYEDEHTQPVHFSNNNHRGTGFQNSSSTAAPRLAPPTPPHRCTAAPPQHCLLDPACQCDSARIAFQRHPKLPSRQRFHTRLEASGGGGGGESSYRQQRWHKHASDQRCQCQESSQSTISSATLPYSSHLTAALGRAEGAEAAAGAAGAAAAVTWLLTWP